MDIYEIVSNDSSGNWIIKNDIIYTTYVAKIPIVTKDKDGFIWVYFDVKIAKQVIKIVKMLISNNIKFLFKSTTIYRDSQYSEEEVHQRNIRQYIRNITRSKFFDGLEKIGFDYINNLAEYLLKFECYDIFKEIFEEEKKQLLKKDRDFYTNTETYRIPREDIRDYLLSLTREVKINMLF